MEVFHKADINDYKTLDPDAYTFSLNGMYFGPFFISFRNKISEKNKVKSHEVNSLIYQPETNKHNHTQAIGHRFIEVRQNLSTSSLLHLERVSFYLVNS